MLFSQRFTLAFAVALWAHSFGDAFLQTLSPRRLLRAPATRMSSFSVTLVDPSGERQTFDCPEDMTIIDGAEEILGIDLPASCRSGSCTSCQVPGRLRNKGPPLPSSHLLCLLCLRSILSLLSSKSRSLHLAPSLLCLHTPSRHPVAAHIESISEAWPSNLRRDARARTHRDV